MTATGHIQSECTRPRKIIRDDIEDIPAEQAWAELLAAVEQRDVDDCKEAIQKYIKQEPGMTYVQLQAALLEQGTSLYLIATERALVGTFTNMDLQGNLGKKYTISYRFSKTPARPREADGWPKDEAEILERLNDAGEPVPNGLPRCINCSEIGHISKNCPQEKREIPQPAVTCFNCGETGHRFRDCKAERVDKFGCKNCG